jgi:hypothetical protein
MRIAPLTIVVAMLLSQGARAEGNLLPYIPELDRDKDVVLLSSQSASARGVRGRVCFGEDSVNTHLLNPSGGTRRSCRAAAFARTLVLVSRDVGVELRDTSPWKVRLSAVLAHKTTTAPILMLFFDLDERGALEGRRFMALRELAGNVGSRLVASVRLLPEDGFSPGHRYRVRLIQLHEARERHLAEGELVLQ